MTEIQPILDIIQGLGIWAVFMFLFIQERKEHNETRKYYEIKIEQLTKNHMDDLRDLIGIKQSLSRVQATVETYKGQSTS